MGHTILGHYVSHFSIFFYYLFLEKNLENASIDCYYRIIFFYVCIYIYSCILPCRFLARGPFPIPSPPSLSLYIYIYIYIYAHIKKKYIYICSVLKLRGLFSVKLMWVLFVCFFFLYNLGFCHFIDRIGSGTGSEVGEREGSGQVREPEIEHGNIHDKYLQKYSTFSKNTKLFNVLIKCMD